MKKVTGDIIFVIPGIETIEEEGAIRSSSITQSLEWFNGTAWILLSLGEAPIDSYPYTRKDGIWNKLDIPDLTEITEHINDNLLHLALNEKQSLQAANAPSAVNALVTEVDIEIINGGYF